MIIDPTRRRSVHASTKELLPLIASALVLGPLGTTRAECATVFVDAAAPIGGNGASWSTSFRFLQEAVEAAAVPGSGITEIRVAQGTYQPDRSSRFPDGTGDRHASFVLLDGVALRGGYAGIAGAIPDARDISAYATVLSGDLPGDDGPNWLHYDNNSFHVVRADGSGDGAILDGVTVRGGYASWQSSSVGARIEIVNASPSLLRCTFEQCLASSGGALFCDGGNPAIEGCSFIGNLAWGSRGGAAYFGTPSAPVLRDCTFSGNQAYGAGGPGDAGAIFLEWSCPAVFDHCVFVNNTSSTSGSTYPTGGAISALSDDLTFDGCRFLKNSSVFGAGGAVWTASDHSFFSGCEFAGNSATVGGAVAVFLAVDVAFSNCTIVANSAGDGGGLSLTYSSVASISNCIFWANIANAASPYKAAIHKDETSNGDVSWTCIEEMWVPEPDEDPLDPDNFPGCTDADPLFVDGNGADNLYGTVDDDYRLSAGSPLIDAANNAAVPAFTTSDVAGLPRFMDDPATTDTGEGPAPVVDMGANEFGDPRPTGDLNGDGLVNAVDLALMLGAWGTSDAVADLNDDGVVDAVDLALLLGAWGNR